MPDIAIHFRNHDAPKLEQRVHITFKRETLTDESPDLSFLEQDYSDTQDPKERAKYKRQDRARLSAYNRGDWHMTGRRVVATVLVPIGGNSFTRYELASAGLWGVESDCGDEYAAEVWAQEEADLRSAMRDMGTAFLALTESGK